jgi:hypothetical protein
MSDSEPVETVKKGKNGQVGRTDKQKEATQKALAKLKEQREKVNDMLKEKEVETHKKKVEDADERILSRLMNKLMEEEEAPAKTKSKDKKKIIVEESESSESEPEIVYVKKANAKVKPKKKIIVEQSESSEEEEVIRKAKKKYIPKPKAEPAAAPVAEVKERKTTGNKMLDKLYGYA